MAHLPSFKVLRSFESIIDEFSEDNAKSIGIDFPFPSFPADLIEDLILETQMFLMNKPSLIRVQSPVYVVGDIHGNIFDLIRILSIALPPPHSSYVFLGDYVDRGQYSTEVVLLLFALQCQYPDNVVLLRGNHEFAETNSVYGFFDEIHARFPANTSIYDTFNNCFEFLPVAALVDNNILCVHGGLSPELNDISQLERIKKPVKSCDEELVADIMWSDPEYNVKMYERSARGLGVQFGTQMLEEFLEKTKIKKIIRGHQCVQNGIQKFDQNLYTVFSSSNYADAGENRCGLLLISDSDIACFSLPCKIQLDISKAVFKDYQELMKLTDLPEIIPFSYTTKIIDLSTSNSPLCHATSSALIHRNFKKSLSLPKISHRYI